MFKCISGMQNGADEAGLVSAKKFGIPTGGMMPKGFRTLDGNKPEYAKLYNIQEHSSPHYPPRTFDNIKNSDGTIRFAFNFLSAGEICTKKGIDQYKRPFIDVDLNKPRPYQDVVDWMVKNNIQTLNVAGNSERTHSGTFQKTFDYLCELFKLLGFKEAEVKKEIELEDLKQKLSDLCFSKIGDLDERYQKKLKDELREIDVQMENDYFLDLYGKQSKFKKNDNNLLIPYLLGMVDHFDIEKESVYELGEVPDVDSDYSPEVMQYLKKIWTPETFGKDNVCNIGNYTTFGIKSSLIDMTKVHDKDRGEILDITTKIGLKDEDGNNFTWKTVMEEYPLLKEYCDKNPEIADSASRLFGRNRGMGVHAGGIIIANQPINNLVPLVIDKEGRQVSAFVEGLHGTDLSPLGLIKFDVLGLKTLDQIAKACHLIKQRHGLKSICAKPGLSDWTDDFYINDPKALSLANQGKTKGVFQFDSEGIMELLRRGGVQSFKDMEAYNAIYRPAALTEKMHDRYIERKHGREKYELHPVLKPILEKTYGVMVYQELIMKILHVVGKIPLEQCEIIRKAISKKKVETFGKYKEMFLINGQKVLGWDREQITELWSQVQSFSGYGFNKSHSCAYAHLAMRCLYLKAHYPLEFFSATLNCENNVEKIKEYRRDAESMGIPVKRIDINCSKHRFEIVDNIIYMGFSNIKGIGDDAGKKIFAGQPYTGLEDFLNRFGTNADVLKPLIALRTFGKENPEKLFEYYEYFKKEKAKVHTCNVRFEKRLVERIEEVRYLLKDLTTEEEIQNFLNKNEEDLNYPEEINDQLKDILKKHNKAKQTNIQKNEEAKIISLENFEPSGHLDEQMKTLLGNVIQIAEDKYYGFSWEHLLETSPEYKGGWTFSDFEADETAYVRMCEVHVAYKPVQKTSAKGTVYYLLDVEDANTRRHTVVFWLDDYERFKEELEYWQNDTYKGHFLRMRLKKPEFNRWYSFDSPSKQFRWRDVPKDKSDDARLQIMARPTIVTQMQPKQKMGNIVEITDGVEIIWKN